MNENILERLKIAVNSFSGEAERSPNMVMMKKSTYLDILTFMEVEADEISDIEKMDNSDNNTISVDTIELRIILTENVGDEFILATNFKK